MIDYYDETTPTSRRWQLFSTYAMLKFPEQWNAEKTGKQKQILEQFQSGNSKKQKTMLEELRQEVLTIPVETPEEKFAHKAKFFPEAP